MASVAANSAEVRNPNSSSETSAKIQQLQRFQILRRFLRTGEGREARTPFPRGGPVFVCWGGGLAWGALAA
jgi:hypothetical protein